MAMERRNLWFGAAWVLLVVAVAVGFLIQGQVIKDLNSTQRELVGVTKTQQKLIVGLKLASDQFNQQLCDLLLTIVEEIKEPTGLDLTDEVVRSFQKVEIDCRVPVEPGG